MEPSLARLALLLFGIATASLSANEPPLLAGGKFECQQGSGSFTLSLASSNEHPDKYVVTILAKPHDQGKGVSANDEAKSLAALFNKLKASGFNIDNITHLYLPSICAVETRQRVAAAAAKSEKWQRRTRANSATVLVAMIDESDAFDEIRNEVVANGLAIAGYSVERIFVEHNAPKTWVTFVRLDKPRQHK